MSTPVRVAAFLAALVAAFAAALGAGRLVGPVDVAAASGEHGGDHAGTQVGDGGDGGAEHDDGDHATSAAEVPGGLMVSADGHTLALEETVLPAGEVALRFRVLGPGGAPVTSYDVEHEKELHLIVVRRDFGGFQHVHPTRDPSGTWSTDVVLTPGAWRVFADFAPAGGEGVTLGADLLVPGASDPAGPAPERLTDTLGGYTVAVTGDLTAGASSELTATVTRDGEEVTDLEPYLGAYGHLVALREGDLAYLHVHPEEAGPGPRVPFVAEVPSAGRYRLFFDFQHDGVVRTASFVLGTTGTPAPDGPDDDPDDDPDDEEEDESHDH